MPLDNIAEIYSDGTLAYATVTQGRRTVSLAIPVDTQVAVRAVNNAGLIGILASWGSLTTNLAWKCVAFEPEGDWTRRGYDDSAWPQAVSYGTNGVSPYRDVTDVAASAEWIWTDSSEDREVWCRGPGKPIMPAALSY